MFSFKTDYGPVILFSSTSSRNEQGKFGVTSKKKILFSEVIDQIIVISVQEA